MDSTERKIFEAAIVVFARSGRAAARMQDIADEAGINKALVHYYFRSKDKLYEKVARYLFRTYFETLGQSLTQTTTFAEALRTFIGNVLNMLQENGHLHRFIIREAMDGAPVLSTLIRDAVTDMSITPPVILMTRIREGMKSGELRKVDPEQTLITIIGACVFYFLGAPLMRTFIPMMDEDFEGFTEKRKKHVFDLLYAGVRNPRRT